MWSTGVIIYMLLSGLLPFGGDNDHETMEEVKTLPVDFDYEEFDYVGEEAMDLCTQLLQKDAEQRLSAADSLDHAFVVSAFSRYAKAPGRSFAESSKPPDSPPPLRHLSSSVRKNIQKINAKKRFK